MTRTRRTFLADIGRGALLATLGGGLAAELGLVCRGADIDPERLDFGALETLASLQQETPSGRILEKLVAEIRRGTGLEKIVAAAALANARCFGGHDYEGYHAFMALRPALQMARQSAGRLAPLPVLKVLHRNNARMQRCGGRAREALRPIEGAPLTGDPAERLEELGRRRELAAAERGLHALAAKDASAAYDAVQPMMRDNLDVHQVVLTWRAWDLMQLAGTEHASALLRQTVRQNVDRERSRLSRGRREPRHRAKIPLLLERHGLVEPALGRKPLDDAAFAELVHVATHEDAAVAAEAVARHAAAGVAPSDLAEALWVAAASYTLCDPGRRSPAPGKPRGSVHGASVGVHAADSAHAWAHVASVTTPRQAAATIVTAAWHTAARNRRFPQRVRHAACRERARTVPPEKLIASIDACIRDNDQLLAAALVERYGAAGLEPDALWRTLLPHAVENDGALHHEKFFRTCFEGFARTRPSHRWIHPAALARVLASGHGFTPPALAEARRLLLA